MAEIHINPNDLYPIIQSYVAMNNKFVLTNFTGSENKKICTFIINGKQCTISIFIKKTSINIIPIGKNIEEAKHLVEFIASKGYSVKADTHTVTFKFSREKLASLLKYITEEYNGKISYTINGNCYRFEGFNKDYLTLNIHDTNKAVLQGRPYYVFNAIVLFLSELDDFSIEEIVNVNNAIINQSTPFSVIRDLINVKLGNANTYLDEPLIKSISGSLAQQNQGEILEDYTGCVTGVFKALEGYLKKLLNQKYDYNFPRNEGFIMFKQDCGKYEIEFNTTISSKDIAQLINLYKLYKNQRNPNLHASVDPSQTRIIETKKEAVEISDSILNAIKESYKIIFG